MELGSLGFDALEEELATLASQLFAGTCRWLELVEELDRPGCRPELGQGSCAQWLAWRSGLAAQESGWEAMRDTLWRAEPRFRGTAAAPLNGRLRRQLPCVEASASITRRGLGPSARPLCGRPSGLPYLSRMKP